MVDKPGWCVTANADNATATATKAAPSGGSCHYVTSISGTFSLAPATASKTLILSNGAVEIGRWYVGLGPVVIAFGSPIQLSPATAANLALAASGAGATIGAATMTGFTL